MVKKSIINQYLVAGKQLTLLSGKRPIIKDWVNTWVDNEVLYNHDGNIGWVLGVDDLVIDVDPRNGGDVSFRKLQKNCGIIMKPTVCTPSGGFHVYLRLPKNVQGKRFRKILKSYQGIDFLTRGSQCVIAGSVMQVGDYDWKE